MSTKIEPDKIASAVVHWLEYQWLCGRACTFSEASLRQPVGEFLLTHEHLRFQAEVLYPNRYQPRTGRPRAMDFGMYGKSISGRQQVLKHAIESKFITAKRDFKQELYDDVYRLGYFQPSREGDSCRRWLVVAGFWKNLNGANALAGRVQIGRGMSTNQVPAFDTILSQDLNSAEKTVTIATDCPERLRLWKEAAGGFQTKNAPLAGPNKLTVRFAARQPAKDRNDSYHPADLVCFVWEIQRPADYQEVGY